MVDKNQLCKTGRHFYDAWKNCEAQGYVKLAEVSREVFERHVYGGVWESWIMQGPESYPYCPQCSGQGTEARTWPEDTDAD
jgi:hypothetical protein